MDNEEYHPDPYLIIEDDADLIERLGPLWDEIQRDEDELGAFLLKNKATVKKAPNGPRIIQQWQRKLNNQKRAGVLVRKVAKKQPVRRQVCASHYMPKAARVTKADVIGRSKTPAPVFAVLDFDDGPLTTSIRAMSGQTIRMVKAFHKGIDDDGGPYGSDTPIDDHRTNLISGGAMPDGSTFICHGVDVDLTTQDRTEMNPADLRLLGDAQLRWSVGNGALVVQLTRVADCPPTGGVITAAGGGDERGVRFTGRPFRSKSALFTLKGGEKGHEMQIEFPDPTLELVKKCRMRIMLRGEHYQRMGGR